MSVLSPVRAALIGATCVLPTAQAQSVLFTAAGDSANDTFGQCVDIVGDVNGDGFADLLAGAWRDDPSGKSDAGTVRVISGKTGLTPTSNLFDVGHRIRVDVSSSNWPRLDANPNTGEPMGRHTHQAVAEQTVYADADHPSHIVLPVIPG